MSIPPSQFLLFLAPGLEDAWLPDCCLRANFGPMVLGEALGALMTSASGLRAEPVAILLLALALLEATAKLHASAVVSEQAVASNVMLPLVVLSSALRRR